MSAFVGFPDDTWAFLGDLANHNDTEWFRSAKPRYQRSVADPCSALVEALAPLLGAVHPGLRAEPKVGRSLFRINRDTRFAADKTPYKTHLDFLFWVECGLPPRESPALIMRLTATDTLVGAGRMGLRDAALARYRTALQAEPSVVHTVETLLADGCELSEADRARVPAGLPADHVAAGLARRDGFHVSRTVHHPPEISGSKFAPWCADRFQAFAPLLDWFAAVG